MVSSRRQGIGVHPALVPIKQAGHFTSMRRNDESPLTSGQPPIGAQARERTSVQEEGRPARGGRELDR